MFRRFFVYLMHLLFWASEMARLWAFKQIMKHGTTQQMLALVRRYYEPMFRAMGYDVDVQVVEPPNEASDKAGMLKMLEGPDARG